MDPRRRHNHPHPSTTTSTSHPASHTTSHPRRLFPQSRSRTASRRANLSHMSSQSSLSTLHIPAEEGEGDASHDLVEKDATGEYVLERPEEGVHERSVFVGVGMERGYERGYLDVETASGLAMEGGEPGLGRFDDGLEKRWCEVMEDSEEDNIRATIEMHGKTEQHWENDQVLQSEIKRALAMSLEKKVASLEEDKWMFEGDAKFRR